MSTVRIQPLTTIKELEKVQPVEQKVWGNDPVPIHQTLTAVKNGGLMLGAFAGDALIGFNYSFPGFQQGQSYLCSHMMGILPEWQRQGIGQRLKWKQREMAQQQGYHVIMWTYDPLESVNARLNVGKLKGIGATYIENCYGEMKDRLNQGLPSDRFQVEWWVNSPHVAKYQDEEAKATTQIKDEAGASPELSEPGQEPSLGQEQVLSGRRLLTTEVTEVGDGSVPVLKESPQEEAQEDTARLRKLRQQIQQGAFWWVPIPIDFQTVKEQHFERAYEWRMKTRAVFQALLQEGFVAADVQLDKKQKVQYYLFQKRSDLSLKRN